MSKEMECPFCGYRWRSRKANPKACPRCKYRLDTSAISEEKIQAAPETIAKRMAPPMIQDQISYHEPRPEIESPRDKPPSLHPKIDEIVTHIENAKKAIGTLYDELEFIASALRKLSDQEKR